MNGAVGQARRTVAARDFTREHGAHRAVDIANGELDDDGCAALDGFTGVIDQLVIERLVESVVLRLHAAPGDAQRHLRVVQQHRQVEALGLPVVQRRTRVQHVHTAHHLIEGAEPHLRHVAADLLGNEEEKVDDVLGRAAELGAQRRVLRGHSHRAGVEVALAHHDAAQRHQRRGRETELLGAQQRGDHYVAAGL